MSHYIRFLIAGTLGMAAVAAALAPSPVELTARRMAEAQLATTWQGPGFEAALERAVCLVSIRATHEGCVSRIALDFTGEPAWWLEAAEDGSDWVLHLGNTVCVAPYHSTAFPSHAALRSLRTGAASAQPWFCTSLHLRLSPEAGLAAQWQDGCLEIVAKPREFDNAPAKFPRPLQKTQAALAKLKEVLARQTGRNSDRAEDGASLLARAKEACQSLAPEEAFAEIESLTQGLVLGKDTGVLAKSGQEEQPGGAFREVTLAQLDLALQHFAPLAATTLTAEEALGEDSPLPENAPWSEGPPPPRAPKRGKEVHPESMTLQTNGDPLYARVSVDLREAELSDVVALWGQMAQINIVAGSGVEVIGPVTVHLREVPLIRAIETVLRINDLGLVEEEGIFRIVPYEESVAERSTSRMIPLANGSAVEIADTLESVAQGFPEGEAVSVSTNAATNVIIVTGPEKLVDSLEQLAQDLDVADITLKMATKIYKLNYATPEDVVAVIEPLLTGAEGGSSQPASSSAGGEGAQASAPAGEGSGPTPRVDTSGVVGSIRGDGRSRQVIVTDLPDVLARIDALILEIDKPVKLVSIESMIVNAVMRDGSQTGVNWLLDLVREHDSVGNVVGPLPGRSNARGDITSSAHELNMQGNLGNIGSDTLDAGVLGFHVLTGGIDLRGAIAAEVASSNAEILANPVVKTLENKEARIQIVTEYPYQELTQTTQGPPVSSTEFKEIGIELRATPRVTHDDDILVDLYALESSIQGLTQDGIPISDSRSATTNLRTGDGQTIFIGGLRDISHRNDVSKIPLLGDIPVMNFMFRTTDIQKIHSELLIFLTCHVMQERMPDLTPRERTHHDRLSQEPRVPNTQKDLFRSLLKPNEMRDPVWKWRRTP